MAKDCKSKTDSHSPHLILLRNGREKSNGGWAIKTKVETYFLTLLDKCQKLLIEQLGALQDPQSNASSPVCQGSSNSFKLLSAIKLMQSGKPRTVGC